MNIQKLNKELKGKSPQEIIEWSLSTAQKPVITTNFRPYEVALISAVVEVNPSIKVVWCDTGYNTPETYRHARDIIQKFDLNIDIYVPKLSAGYRDVLFGIPEVDTEEHRLFTEQVKLEPFRRAMKEHQPDVWFTNLRKGQTAFRDSIDILSVGNDGILKVSPFYNWSDSELDEYLTQKALPNEHTYYDPTKVLSNRECGLHA